MALFKFRLPDIGEGIAEAEIVQWHVKVGDRIEEDANLADMMTDKATVEMESPVSGIVVELAGEVGDMVPIGSTLAVIEVEGEDAVEARVDAETPDAETVEAVTTKGLEGRPQPDLAELVEAPSRGAAEERRNGLRQAQPRRR